MPPKTNVEPITEHEIEDAFLIKTRAIVLEHLDESEFGVKELGQELHMSKMQCYRKIKALTDKTPSALIRSIRLGEARIKLQNTDLNISEVAYETGFRDPSYFSRCFQDEFGHPPSSVRK